MHGLRIHETARLPAEFDTAAVDVVWLREEVGGFPADPDSAYAGYRVRALGRDDGVWTEHGFRAEGITYCVIEVSPDGRRVHSRALRTLAPENVEELLYETVLRGVLVRLGLVSFHAAALVREGRAVLLMGNKGAGKSTLSSALLAAGWTLLADDLVRLDQVGGRWHAMPGRARIKLHADSLVAGGRSPADTSLRWTGPLPDVAVGVQKYVLEAGSPAPLQAVPLQALCCLMPRAADRADIRIERSALPVAAVLAAEHLTRDPLARSAPPAFLGQGLGRLLQEVPLLRVCLPDSLAALPKSAQEFSRWLDVFHQ